MDNNKKKTGIIIGVIIAVLVIIGGVFAYLYFATDTFKTSEQLFYSYLTQNEQVLKGMDVTDSMTSTKDMLKDKQYTTNGAVSLSYSKDSQIENVKIITVEGKTDELEQQAYSKIKLLNPSNEKEELFNVEYLRTNDLYALTSNQVVNLYLAVQNNNLKSFVKKLGIEDASQIPNKIENLEEKSEVSEEQLKGIFDKYSSLLMERIPSEKYTKQKNVSMTINEQNYNKLDIYTLALNQKELASALKPILQTLKDDDETLNTILELYKTEKTLDDLNELKNQIQEWINELDSSELTDDVAIKINVYVQDKQLIKTQLQLGNGTDEGIIIGVIPTKTEQETKILCNLIDVEDSENSLDFSLTISKTNGIKAEINVNGTAISLNYQEQAKDENTITKQINMSCTADKETVQLVYDEEKVITQDLKIDKLDSNTNCVILNDYPQETLQLLMAQIGERLGQIFTEIGGKAEITNIMQELQSQLIYSDTSENDTEQEKEIFNEQFIYYDVQNISGTNVEALLNTIISSNKNTNNEVGVIYNGSENKTTEEDINNIISKLELDNSYNVSFEYSDEGYINLVTITQTN